ncbi:MAG TPA: hypothetical protein VIG06_08530 [Kofleriaceae bacterium]
MRELRDIPRRAACTTCASIDGAGHPGEAARQDLVLAVERVEVHQVGLAVESLEHRDHGSRVVAGGDQQPDGALVRLDLVVALVGQAATDRAGVAEEGLAVDLEELVPVVEGDVRHLVGEERRQLRLRAQATERSGGDVDEAAQDGVALRLRVGQDAEVEVEVRASGVRRDPPTDPGDVCRQPAIGVRSKKG